MTYDARKLLYQSSGAFPQTQITGYDETTQTFNALRVDQFGRLSSENYVWDTGSMEWVPSSATAVASSVGVLDSSNTRIDPATNGAVNALNGFSLPVYDYISMGYTGANLTTVVYKLGGSGGTTVATLTLGYTGADLTSITRS